MEKREDKRSAIKAECEQLKCKLSLFFNLVSLLLLKIYNNRNFLKKVFVFADWFTFDFKIFGDQRSKYFKNIHNMNSMKILEMERKF